MQGQGQRAEQQLQTPPALSDNQQRCSDTAPPQPSESSPTIPSICPVLDILVYLELLPCLTHPCNPSTLTLLKSWQIFCSPAPHLQSPAHLCWHSANARGRGGAAAPPRELLRQYQAGGGFRKRQQTLSSSDTRSSQQTGEETAAFPTPAALLCSRNSNSLLISQAEGHFCVSGEKPLLGSAAPARCAHLLPQISPYSEMHYMPSLFKISSLPLTLSSSTSYTKTLCHKRAFGVGLISKLNSPHCFPRLWDPWREQLCFD